MSLVIGDNFSYQGSKPLDARLKYDTLAHMVATAENTLYNGIIAYCEGEDKTYQWKSTNEVDQTLAKWREYTSGGSASDLSPADVALVKQNFQVNPYGTMPTEMTASDVIAVKNAFVLT